MRAWLLFEACSKNLHIELTKKPNSYSVRAEKMAKRERDVVRKIEKNDRKCDAHQNSLYAAVSWVNFYYEFYYESSSQKEENEANCVLCPLPISSQFFLSCFASKCSVTVENTNDRRR